MKDKRNCGDNMYPVYPMNPGIPNPNLINPAFTGPMIPTTMPYYSYNQTNTNTTDINNIERQLNSLESRVNNLEKKVNGMNNTPNYNAGNNNTYTDSNYYMV